MALYDYLAKAFGAVYVEEQNNLIEIGGINTADLFADINRVWGSSRIAKHMFNEIRPTKLVMYSFFGVDLLYMFQQIIEYKARQSNKYRLQKAVDQLQTNTWLRTLKEPHESIIDLTVLKDLDHQPLTAQLNFLHVYNEKVPKMRVNGFLIAADPGTGKTYMSIAAAHCLHSDIEIVISPMNAVDDAWVSGYYGEYHNQASVWASTHTAPLTDKYKRYVFHYSAMDRAIEFARQMSHRKITIILDESHNFNDINSTRTKQFIYLCRVSNSKNIMFLSGTPVKALGLEMITLFTCIDPMFTPEVAARFRMIYGMSAKRANDILRNRLDLVSIKIPKSAIMKLPEPDVIPVKIRIKNPERFTLDTIKKELRIFMEERYKFYKKNLSRYETVFSQSLQVYEKSIRSYQDAQDLKKYREFVKIISQGYDPSIHKEMVEFCSHFEKTKIFPALPSQLKKQFKDAISVIKFVKLKILGEALGGVYGQKRAQCHVEMVRGDCYIKGKYAGKLDHIVYRADKKTLLFTSFVPALKEAIRFFTELGLNNRAVYADTNRDLVRIILDYKTKPTVNPLLATYQSLQASVTLIIANTVILLDLPFREYIRTQAINRVYRFGQDTLCFVFECTLDTGNIPNISTRSEEIMRWSEEQVRLIMGKDVKDAKGIVQYMQLNQPSTIDRLLYTFRGLFD